DEDMCAMRGILDATIRASSILGIDPELRAKWSELLANLAPIPSSDNVNASKPADYKGPEVWVRSLKPAIKAGGLLPDGNSLPAWMFDLAKPGDPVAENTLNALLRGTPGPQTTVGLLSKVPMAAAAMGRGEAMRYLIPNQMRGVTRTGPPANLRNHMSLREGAQALDAEALGRASEALHLSLLQGLPEIRVFPAWPKGWDAT